MEYNLLTNLDFSLAVLVEFIVGMIVFTQKTRKMK